MFYIAICDDEQMDLDIIIKYLNELKRASFQLEIVPFTNGEELIKVYQSGRRFDLIILDMLMEPINGIETARDIRTYDTNVPILVVTATVEFAMDGYQVNVYRYILKPLDKEYFLKEVQSVLKLVAREQTEYFNFTNERGLSKIKLSEIYYFESNVRTITICTLTGKVSFTGKISEVEEQLATQNFIRPHKSYVVNLKHIRNIFKDVITMENSEELPLSKHKSRELRLHFLEYMKVTV